MELDIPLDRRCQRRSVGDINEELPPGVRPVLCDSVIKDGRVVARFRHQEQPFCDVYNDYVAVLNRLISRAELAGAPDWRYIACDTTNALKLIKTLDQLFVDVPCSAMATCQAVKSLCSLYAWEEVVLQENSVVEWFGKLALSIKRLIKSHRRDIDLARVQADDRKSKLPHLDTNDHQQIELHTLEWLQQRLPDRTTEYALSYRQVLYVLLSNLSGARTGI